MKKILLSAVIAFACFQSTMAQEPKTPNKPVKATPEKMVQRMDRALDLNEEQEKQLLAIYSDCFKKNAKANDQKDRKERIAQRKAMNEKINAVLTKEQQEKWASIKKAKFEKRKEKINAKKNKE